MNSTYNLNKKKTYIDCCNENAIKKALIDNPAFEEIFNILNLDDALIRAIAMIKLDKPALAANAKAVEDYVDSHPNCGIDLNDHKTKQNIGILQKAVLEPFGLVPVKQKHLSGLKYFKSASCYKFSKPAKLTVKTVIVDCDDK